MKTRRGSVLSAILAGAFVILIGVLAVAATGLTHVRSVNAIICQSLAEDMGDSLVTLALVKLKADGNFGKNGERISHDFKAYGEPSVTGYLVFGADPSESSTNNSDGSFTGQGYGNKPVPIGTVQLVANISVRNLKYRYVVLVAKALFPHVVATQGRFSSNGPLLLGALKSLDGLKDGLQLEDLKRGSLLSNSDLSIQIPADVIGDLTTAGSASVGGVNHVGDLKEFAKPEDVPYINLSEYDPAGKPEIANYQTRDRIGDAPLAVAGLARYSGAPLVLRHGLNLNSGVFFVDGDLVVENGVKGYGALFCTGTLKVSGGSDLASDYLCALVSQGDLTITGSDARTTQFRGLVYSNGAIKVSGITVVGSLVGSSAPGGPVHEMSIERSNLVYDPKAVQLDFNLQFSGLNKVDPFRRSATLRPGAALTPLSLWDAGANQFRQATQEELQQALLFHFPGNDPSPKTWDELSEAERLSANVVKLLGDAKNVVSNQIGKWNQEKLTPETGASFHLDLNRFVKVQTGLRFLTRRLERV